MDMTERQVLHLQIGLYLGTVAGINTPASNVSETISQLRVDDNQEFFGGLNSLTSSLLSITCDQIIMSGPEAMKSGFKEQFARWIQRAGNEAASHFDFRARCITTRKG